MPGVAGTLVEKRRTAETLVDAFALCERVASVFTNLERAMCLPPETLCADQKCDSG